MDQHGVEDRCAKCGRVVRRGWTGKWYHVAEFPSPPKYTWLDRGRTRRGYEVHARRSDYPNRAVCGVGGLVEDALPDVGVSCKRCLGILNERERPAV